MQNTAEGQADYFLCLLNPNMKPQLQHHRKIHPSHPSWPHGLTLYTHPLTVLFRPLVQELSAYL